MEEKSMEENLEKKIRWLKLGKWLLIASGVALLMMTLFVPFYFIRLGPGKVDFSRKVPDFYSAQQQARAAERFLINKWLFRLMVIDNNDRILAPYKYMEQKRHVTFISACKSGNLYFANILWVRPYFLFGYVVLGILIGIVCVRRRNSERELKKIKDKRWKEIEELRKSMVELSKKALEKDEEEQQLRKELEKAQEEERQLRKELEKAQEEGGKKLELEQKLQQQEKIVNQLAQEQKKTVAEKQTLDKELKELEELLGSQGRIPIKDLFNRVKKFNRIPHLFMCWKYSPEQKTAIVAHQEVLQGKGHYNFMKEETNKFVWWGKFRYEVDKTTGKETDLEPIGEEFEGAQMDELCREVMAKITGGKVIYLYLCNPNPPYIILHVAKVEEIVSTRGDIPSTPVGERPSCAYMPDYYFFREREKSCTNCTKRKDDCRFKFKCNVWFKLSEITPLLPEEFDNILDVRTQQPINFAIPIRYPCVVIQESERNYFGKENNIPLEIPAEKREPIEKVIPEKERGHVKIERVENFANKLYRQFNFIKGLRLEEIVKEKMSTHLGSLNAYKEKDKLKLYLGSEYHHYGGGLVLSILLHSQTTDAQKKESHKQIGNYINTHPYM